MRHQQSRVWIVIEVRTEITRPTENMAGGVTGPAIRAVGAYVPGTDYKPDFIAGGFGLTLFNSDNGTEATHKQFVLDAMDDSLREGANEACIACHTRKHPSGANQMLATAKQGVVPIS